MAERIIYDIEFNGLDDSLKKLDKLTAEQVKQRKVIKESQDAIKNYDKELKSLNNDIEEQGVATDEQIQRQEQLNKQIQDASIQLANEKDVLSVLNKERREAVKTIDLETQAQTAAAGSNEQLSAQLRLQTKEYNALSKEERENSERGIELTASIKNLSDKLKENESAVGNNTRNVGNYEQAITSALGKVNIFGVNLGQVTMAIKEGVAQGQALVKSTLAQAEATTAAATANKAAEVSTGRLSKAMNVLKIALISTGIGAIVVALGALVAAFASTQRGADALNRIIIPIKFALAGLWGVIQDLSFALVDGAKSFNSFGDVLKGFGNLIRSQIEVRVQSAIDLFGFLGSAVKKVFSGDFAGAMDDAKKAASEFVDIQTGVDNTLQKVGSAIDSVNKKVKQSIANGKEFAATQEAIAIAQRRLTIAIAQTNTDLKEQMDLSSDQTKSDEERIQALEKAQDLIKLKEEQQATLIESRLKLAKLEAAQNDSDNAALQNIADLEAELITLRGEAFSQQKRITSQLSGLRKAQIKQEEDRINKVRELIQTQDEALQKERDAQIESLGLNKEETELTEEELSAREKINQDYYDALAKIQFDSVNEMLDQQGDYLTKENLELEKSYYEQLLIIGNNEEAKKQLDAKYAADRLAATKNALSSQIQVIESELNQLSASGEDGIFESILTDEQKEDLERKLLELQVAFAKTNAEMQNLGKDEDGQPIGNSLANSLGIDEETAINLQAGYQSVMGGISDILAAANQNIADVTAQRIADIDKDLENGVISEKDAEIKKEAIRKEAFEKQKKLQIAMATVNYFQGLISAIANAMQYPFPANLIIGAVGTAALTTGYALNMKNLKAQKFEDGGMIKGASHKNGGVPFTVKGQAGFEAEGGEFIQRKKAVNYYGTDFMESINALKFPKLFEEGGLVAPQPLQSVSQSVGQGVAPISEAISNQRIEVINVESKFTKVQKNVSNVEKAATY